MVAEHGHRYGLFNAPDTWTNPPSFLPIGYFISRLVAYKVSRTGSDKDFHDILKRFVRKFKDRPNFVKDLFYAVAEDAGLTEDSLINMRGIAGFPASVRDIGSLYEGLIANWQNERPDLDWKIALIGDVGDLYPAASHVYFSLFGHSDQNIFIFGHTHKVDLKKNYLLKVATEVQDIHLDLPCRSIYANTGTWVDSAPYCTYVETQEDAAAGRHYVRTLAYHPAKTLLQEGFVELGAKVEFVGAKFSAQAIKKVTISSAVMTYDRVIGDLESIQLRPKILRLDQPTWAQIGPPKRQPTPELYWNVWAEDNDAGRFKPVVHLLPNKGYRLCLDLAALQYLAAGAMAFSASQSFQDEAAKWLPKDMPPPSLRVLLLADPAKFDTDKTVQAFEIDLEGLRRVYKDGLPDVEENPFAVLHKAFVENENKKPDFQFGSIYFDVMTKGQEGPAALAFSIWCKERPIDEISHQLCIAKSPEAMGENCPKQGEIAAPQGLLTVRVAAEESVPPAAAVHFVSLGQNERVTGIFRVNAWEKDRFLVWQFSQTADDFRKRIATKLHSLSPSGLADDNLLFRGAGLFSILFPRDVTSFDGKEVHNEVLAFFRSQLQKDNRATDYDPPTIFVRMIQTGPSSCTPVPLGLLAMKLNDQEEKIARKRTIPG